MPNATIPQRAVIGMRPSHTPEGAPIPAEWPIYNTTRPLYGTLQWQRPSGGYDFRDFGKWFAAVDPAPADPFDAKQADWCREENRRLDATELVFVSDADAFALGVQFVRDNYKHPSIVAKLDAKIADPSMRSYFVDKGLECLSISAEAD